MMGMSFNGMGKYVGWSNIFDYSSIEALKASEYLPMPNRTKFIYDKQSGINIDSFVQRINNANRNNLPADRIKAYADLLNYLNDNGITDINWTIEPEENILRTLSDHEFTKIPKNMLEMACKNFISSHILNTVQNFTNMIGAYTPIEIEVLRGASDKSPKGELSKRMTLMNPATKYLMLFLNMTGKNVIGISATGIKGSFTWHYYMNEILLNNKNNSNEKLISRAKFSFKTSRIKGRSDAIINLNTGELKRSYNGTNVIKALPDINWDKISEETKELLFGDGNIDENVLISKLTVDLMQSQVLSAATDNAKELILAKINAGSKLAKCYLFLITLGFDVNDIVAFMTSPVISFIDRITESNIYQGLDLKIKDAINLFEGIIPKSLFYKFMDNSFARIVIRNNNLVTQILDAFILNKLDSIENPGRIGSVSHYQFIDFISYLKQIRSIMPEINDSSKADLQEFKNILEGSDEFSDFSRLLGINQGIKTTEEEFRNYLLSIKSIITKREQALGIHNLNPDKLIELGYDPELVGKFDISRWLEDLKYKEIIKDYYGNKLKICIPIFDIIDEIPQFKASFKLVDAVNVINSNISIKTQINELIHNNYDARYWSDRFKKNLLLSIHAKFIQLFLQKSELKLPYLGNLEIKETVDGKTKIKLLKGASILDKNFDEINAPENSFISFDSISSMAAFKHLFENYIIPKLKEGKYVTVENGNIVEKTDERIKTNKFIQGLIHGTDRSADMPLYRLNVDMLNYDQTPEGTVKVEDYIRGIQALQDIDINGTPLSDWFIIYNLYTNHNNYGSSRMTTIFDSFIDSNGKSSIIKNYFDYIGKLSYYGKTELLKEGIIKVVDDQQNEFEIDIQDLFVMSATTVSNTIGKSDPVYRVVTDSGATFLKRLSSGSYRIIKNSYFTLENSEKILSRQNNIDNYSTVGGIIQEIKNNIIEDLNSLNISGILALNTLLKDNFLEIYKVCK